MLRNLLYHILLALLAAGCVAAPEIYLTTTPGIRQITPVITLTSEDQQPTPPECTMAQADLVIWAIPESVKVGGHITIYVKMTNTGCLMLGLPQYRLVIHARDTTGALEPQLPESIVHSIGIGPGETDQVEFPSPRLRQGA